MSDDSYCTYCGQRHCEPWCKTNTKRPQATDTTPTPVRTPEGSFGYCGRCYHPLDTCSHCEAAAQRTEVARLTAQLAAAEQHVKLLRGDIEEPSRP